MNDRSARVPDSVLGDLAEIVGAEYLLTEKDDQAAFQTEQRGLFAGRADIVLRPKTTDEVSRLVKVCAGAGVPVVPQGGNTGFVGGSVATGGALVNLGRLNQIRGLDAANFTMTVEAGCVLADLQDKASAHDRLFPLSLGAEGSCQIGGNLSTNAGGVGVLRYGNARELTLGLEVVLPNGEIWDGLRALRKDNTGYDLKHLFIGAEGTLGIITAAILKLFPMPASFHAAFVGIDDIRAALEIFGALRQAAGDQLTAFELLPRAGLEICITHVAGVTDPLAAPYPYYLLIEVSDHAPDGALGAVFEAALGGALEQGWARDAVIAQSEEQRQGLWHIRHNMPLAYRQAGAVIGNDVAVPVSQIPDLVTRGIAAVVDACPGIRPVPFGHIGDGNIHFSLLQPVDANGREFLARWSELEAIVTDIALDLGGSFSAEHGIGRLKRDEFGARKSPVEIAIMRQLKDALDPHNLMNPGKIFPNN